MNPPMPAVVSVLLVAQDNGFVRELVLDTAGNIVSDFTLPLHRHFDVAVIRENQECVRRYAEDWRRTVPSPPGWTFTEIRSITVVSDGRVLYCTTQEAKKAGA